MKKVNAKTTNERMRKFEKAWAILEKQQEERFDQLLAWVDSKRERQYPSMSVKKNGVINLKLPEDYPVRHRDPSGYTTVTEDWAPRTVSEFKEAELLKVILAATNIEQLTQRLKVNGKTLEQVFHLWTDEQINNARLWAKMDMTVWPNQNEVTLSNGPIPRIRHYVEKYNMMQTDFVRNENANRGRNKLKSARDGAEATKDAAKARAAEIRRVYSEIKAADPNSKREHYIAATKEHFLKLYKRKKPRRGYGETTIAKTTQGL